MNNSDTEPLQLDSQSYAEACAYLEAAMATLETSIAEARQDILDSQFAIHLDGNAVEALFLLSRAGEKIVAGGKVGLLDVMDAASSLLRSIDPLP